MISRDKILKMEPSRELDGIVAQFVIGWQRKQGKWYGPGGVEYLDATIDPPYIVPRYSVSIAAAWQVIEHIGQTFAPESVHLLTLMLDESEVFARKSAEAALLICRFALIVAIERERPAALLAVAKDEVTR